jgi:hypothetical protein
MRPGFSHFRFFLPAIGRGLLLVSIILPLTPKNAFGQITFTATVPTAPAQVQVYKLVPTPVPTAFLNEKLKAVRLPELKLEQKRLVSRGVTGQTDRDKVRVFADPVSGDSHFIPNLLELAGPANLAKQVAPGTALSVARTALTDIRFIPRDVTELRVSDAIPVMGNSISQGTAGSAATTQPKQVMIVVPAFRYAGGLLVYGTGSRALVSVANDQSITGALRRWRTASLGQKIKPVMTSEQVKADIVRQLTPYAKGGVRATVDKIALAYYDGNANYLQPVYRFEAVLSPPQKGASNIKIAGYVPVGQVLEPIPDLAAQPTGPKPSTSNAPPGAATRAAAQPMAQPGASVITLGEFVNQDWPSSSAYLDMANNFLSGLDMGHFFAPADPAFSRTLWWTAYPWQVNGAQSKQFMNAVNVAYTEPHGDWLLNTTKSNCCDLWYVQNIGTGGNPGFGAAAGGVLAWWLIMSCEVVPSAYDRANEAGGSGKGSTAFDVWWPVFQGMHGVLGFRTEMFYPDDALNFGFGFDAALGGDVNAAWFHEVAAYDGNDCCYNDGHLIGNPSVHFDRASTFIDGRDLGQSIYSVGAQSRSTVLWNFWMGN